MRWSIYFVALALAACKPPAEPVVIVPTPKPRPVARATPIPEASKPPIALPEAPELSEAGHTLILEFETGGRSGYDPHPEWPGASSGVTIGIGYDLGYYSRSVVDSDWNELQPNPRSRLLSVVGLSGARARSVLPTVRDILVAWEAALGVFDNVDVAREFSRGEKAMPGLNHLRPNAQAALISLGFNRGWGLSGPNRSEMRDIRDAVPSRDYELMAIKLREMKRVWYGTNIERAMTRRRLAESRLMETP